MMKYAIVIEKGPRNFSAYVPDLPGCVATGKTVPQVKKQMFSAIAMHLRGMREDGERVPKPTTLCDYVEVAVST